MDVGDEVLLFNGELVNYELVQLINKTQDGKMCTVRDKFGKIYHNCIYGVDVMTPNDYKLYCKKEVGELTNKLAIIIEEINNINYRLDLLDKQIEDNKTMKLTLKNYTL